MRLVSYDLAMRRQLRRDWSIAPSMSFPADRAREDASAAPSSPAAEAVVKKASETMPGLTDFVRKYQPDYSHHVFSLTAKF